MVHGRFSLLLKGSLLAIILCSFSAFNVKAQYKYTGEKEVIPFVYDEIPVLVIIEGYKNFYVDVIYTNNDLLYINIEDLFHTLMIPCIRQRGDSLSGFINHESNTYVIDYAKGQINVGSRIINPKNGLVKESGSLFMESSLFTEAFGILLTFNYRALTMTLKSDFELPIFKQLRIEKMRTNIAKLQGEEIADTVVQRNYHLFKSGMLDWSAASSQTWNGLTDNHFRLGAGGELLYGEADISVDYYSQQKFDKRQLQYLWRWVDNDKPVIKQAQLGNIYNQTISFINAPVIGAVVRNSPTTVRKATGYYTIKEFTEPNWTVELYINNVLVDYTKADASGLYIFKVPVVYGYTTLKLKFYGPLGEERTDERTINEPFTMMPTNEVEYGVSAGILQDSSRSRFGKGEFNYGLTRLLTVGGGLEYLSSIPTGPFIPYAKATLQPFSNLTLNGEYAYGVRTRGLLNYYFGKDALLEIDYAKYVEGQRATIFNAPEERKVKLSVPIRYRRLMGFAKLDYQQLVYDEFKFNQGNIMLSLYYKQFSANTSAQLNWIDQRTPYATSDLALSFRLKNGYTIRQSARYNVSDGTFMTCKTEIEKRIPKGYFSVSYERNIIYSDHFISVNFKYDLPFARTNVSVSQSKGKVNTSESAQGSMAFGGGNNFTHVSTNSSVGRGGILLYPFLDLNQNGIFDTGEHMVKLSTVRINGGKAIFSEKDSIVRIPDLNAFISYNVAFNDFDLENISWRFKNKLYQVLIDPNQFKRVDIPVIAVGEVSGMAYLDKDNSLKGIGRILIKYYRKGSTKVITETLSESDGYIYNMGLAPGDYMACVDPAQLSNLDFTVDPPYRDFTIKPLEDGDIVDGIDFVLRSKQGELPEKQNLATQPNIVVPAKDNPKSLLPISPVISAQPKTDISQDMQKNNLPVPQPEAGMKVSVEKDTPVYIPGDTLYKVQLLALRTPVKDKDYFTQLMAEVPGLTIFEALGEDGLYHYSTGAFMGIRETREILQIIRKSGWKDCFIAIYVGGARIEMKFHLKPGKSGSKFDRGVPAKQILPGGQKTELHKTVLEIPKEQQNILPLEGQKIAGSPQIVHLAERISMVRDTLAYISGDTLYKVQLLALHLPIRVKGYFVRLLTDVPGLTIEELEGEDGLYHYSTGAFRGIIEAREFLHLIKQSGWTDCFIATYTAGKRDEPIFRLKRAKATH